MNLDIPELPEVEPTREGLTKLGIRLCEHENRPAEALRCFEVLLAQDPWDALALNNKAHCLRALGRLQEAQGSCVSAVIIAPRLAEAWCTLGEIQAQLGEKTNARLSYESSIRLAEGRPFLEVIRGHLEQLAS